MNKITINCPCGAKFEWEGKGNMSTEDHKNYSDFISEHRKHMFKADGE